MTAAVCALWGLLGGGVVEALDLAAAIRPTSGRPRWAWPWADEPACRLPYLLSIVLRLAAGAGLAAAASTSGPRLAAPWAAFLAGLGAPVVVERLLRYVKVAPALALDDQTAVTSAPLLDTHARPAPQRRVNTASDNAFDGERVGDATS